MSPRSHGPVVRSPPFRVSAAACTPAEAELDDALRTGPLDLDALGGDAFDFGDIVVAELDVGGGQTSLDVGPATGADDRHMYARLGQRPGDCELADVQPPLPGEVGELGHDGQVLLKLSSCVGAGPAPPVVLLEG